MLRVYVAHDSGAELLSLGDRGCEGGSSSGGGGGLGKGSWEGLNSGQVCALLSSFALFEEGQGLRTQATHSGRLSIQFGRRNDRTRLQPFAILSGEAYEAEAQAGFLQLLEKCIDMVVSPLCLGGGNVGMEMSKRHPKTLALRRVLGQAMQGMAAPGTPSSGAGAGAHGGVDSGSLLGPLERISDQVSNQVSYCASCWIQDGLSPLVWADEEVLAPAWEDREVALSAAPAFDPAALKSALLAISAASCQGEEGEGGGGGQQPSYEACKIYLGDQFLEPGQAQDAAVCGLHVFRSESGGRLRLAMICEGAEPIDADRRRHVMAPISDLLSELELSTMT